MVVNAAFLTMFVLVVDIRDCSADVIEFEPVQFYKTIPGPTVLLTTEATSLIHCASLCLSTAGCVSFDFRCQSLLHTEPGTCNIFSNHISFTSELTTSKQCFVQIKSGGITILPLVLPTSTTALPPSTSTTVTPAVPVTSTTTPTTSTTSTVTTTPSTVTTATSTVTTTSSTVTTATSTVTTTSSTVTTATSPTTSSTTSTSSVGTTTTSTATSTTSALPNVVIHGLLHNEIAFGPQTYLLFTDEGIYVYQTDSDLYTTGPNSGPHSLSSVFTGFSELPPITDVKCVLNIYDTDLIEIYADGKIYVWDDYLNNQGTTGLNVNDYLGATVTQLFVTETIRWCAYRNTFDELRYVGFEPGNLYVNSISNGEITTLINQTSMLSSTDVNKFKGLPSDVRAVANHYNGYRDMFLVIDGNFSVFEYVMSGQEFTLTYRGPLVIG